MSYYTEKRCVKHYLMQCKRKYRNIRREDNDMYLDSLDSEIATVKKRSK